MNFLMWVILSKLGDLSTVVNELLDGTSWKGAVATYESLPGNAESGDAQLIRGESPRDSQKDEGRVNEHLVGDRIKELAKVGNLVPFTGQISV